MTRRRWLRSALLAAALLAALATGALALLAAAAGSGPGSVPTAVVRRGPFRLTVAAEGVLAAAQAQPVAVPSGLDGPARIAWLAADGSRVRAGEVVVRFDPSELEKMRDAAEAGLAKNELEQQRHRAEVAAGLAGLEQEAEVAALEEGVARSFESRDPEIFSRRQIEESRLDGELAGKRRRHAEEARVQEAALAQVKGQLLEIARRSFELDLARARQGLAALEARAPYDGILAIARDWRGNMVKVGDTVWPGMGVAEIPDLSTLQAEVHVLEADAGALAEGRPARVVIEAHPDVAFDGEIARVDKLARQRQRSSPVQYFTVTVRLASTDPERMFPGQRVRAELLLADLEAALTLPRQAVFEKDGRTVAFRLEGSAFRPVPLRLGLVGAGRAVVEEGLEAGDVIALADPAARRPEGGGEGEAPALPAAFQAGRGEAP